MPIGPKRTAAKDSKKETASETLPPKMLSPSEWVRKFKDGLREELFDKIIDQKTDEIIEKSRIYTAKRKK